MIRAFGMILILAAIAILGLDLATSASAPGGLSAATIGLAGRPWCGPRQSRIPSLRA